MHERSQERMAWRFVKCCQKPLEGLVKASLAGRFSFSLCHTIPLLAFISFRYNRETFHSKYWIFEVDKCVGALISYLYFGFRSRSICIIMLLFSRFGNFHIVILSYQAKVISKIWSSTTWKAFHFNFSHFVVAHTINIRRSAGNRRLLSTGWYVRLRLCCCWCCCSFEYASETKWNRDEAPLVLGVYVYFCVKIEERGIILRVIQNLRAILCFSTHEIFVFSHVTQYVL